MKFYLLSFFSGMCEIGCICWGYNQGFSLVEILMLGCAYQFGNIFPRPYNMSRERYMILGIVGLLTCFCSFVLEGVMSYLCMLVAITCCSICVQVSRSVLKRKGTSTTIKRMSRILGFGMSAWSAKCYPVMILIVLIVALSVIAREQITVIQREKIRKHNICTVMILHQMHYFVYVYGILFYVIKQKGMKQAIFYFLGTWITYTLVSPILERSKNKNYLNWFFVGHSFLAVCLILMSILKMDINGFILLWLMAGFGGGTVFCITKIGKKFLPNNSEDMIIAENYGHWWGSICAVIVAGITNDIKFFTLISAIFVLGAMATMVKGVKENGY